MRVYVESNFVLEQALQQEQCDACDQILQLAVARRISLVIPAFSLAEPHQALLLKAKARNRLSNDLRPHIVELGRSRRYQAVPNEFAALTSILIESAERERDGLQRVTSELLAVAEVIPLDSVVLASAQELQTVLGMSGQDSIVLASVIYDLQRAPSPANCFLSRNSRDFDDPDVRARLIELGCEYCPDFAVAVRYIAQRVRG